MFELPDIDGLSEIKKKISDTEDASLSICNELMELCEKSLPRAESYHLTETQELKTLDEIEESYNKIHDDLQDAHRIMRTLFFCPCLPISILNCLAPKGFDNESLNEVTKEKKRGSQFHHF